MANYTNLSFAGNSLQTANIFVKKIDHYSIPAKNMSLLNLDHANKSAIPFTSYPTRVIVIEGTIQGSSIADLDSRLDTFKSWFLAQDQNLDIDYNSGTRRYIATLDSANSNIDRPGGLLYADFSLQFICTQPFGMDTAPTSLLNVTNRTSNTYADNVTCGGTAPFQLPIFTITYNNANTSSTNMITNPGFEVDTTGWSNYGIAGSSIARVTTQHNTGVAALQITNAGTGSGGVFGGATYFIAGLTIGQAYTIGIWLKGNAGGESVKINVPNNTSPTVALTTSWQQFFMSFTATGTTMELDILGLAASNIYFADDVTCQLNASTFVFIGNNNNGQGITINRTLLVGDVIVIDCTKATTTPVTVNGQAVAFSGAFPEFPPGAQQLGYTDGLATRSFNETVSYTPLYL